MPILLIFWRVPPKCWSGFKTATLGKCLQAAAWKKLIPKKNIKTTSPKITSKFFSPETDPQNCNFSWNLHGPHPVRSLERSCWSRAACPIWRRQPVFGGPFLKKHPRCNGSPLSNRFGNLYFWETTRMMNTSWHLKEYEGLLSRWVLWNFTVFKHREQFQPIFTVLGQLGHKRPSSGALSWSV